MTERLTFDTPEVTESFTVDTGRRLISGMVVPWGAVARSAGRKWRFTRGSLGWAASSRIKLNMNHDHTQAIAKAIRLVNTDQGLDATFQVARGPEGDKALSNAEDGVLDGFSIEADFSEDSAYSPDPNDPSVNIVSRARLKGVALTGFPAFDDARVVSVAAMQEGIKMEGNTINNENKEGTSEQEGAVAFETAMTSLAQKVTDSQVKLQEDLAQSLGESMAAGMKAALEEIGSPERGSVRAARFTVTREEPVYRFDGLGDSMVRDAWYAATAHDDDAIERLRKYKMQTEEVARLFADRAFSVDFSPQTTSTASQVIPPGYRPDLYVADLFRERPFVNAASRGVIQNATPFTVPVFTSVTTGSADHVEGTNPSDGSLSFGTKTVAPGAVSGRLVLSRELVDSSNPAIDQIAMQEMRESYARQTEAKVYTLLNGASGSGGTITSGFVPSGSQAATFASTGGTPYPAVALVNGIRQQMALYSFRRFRSPNAVLMGSNATTILATANDSTGRPIFPAVGPMNAVGTSGNGETTWNVDGMAFTPAWAATGVAAGDTQIFILNSSDLWVWESPLLTFRYEEKQGPANIELNIFGYFGTHLLRPVGLSGIRIT